MREMESRRMSAQDMAFDMSADDSDDWASCSSEVLFLEDKSSALLMLLKKITGITTMQPTDFSDKNTG